MSKSPHRLRGDASEVFRYLLFGEILRAFELPAEVRDEPSIRLPMTGRWEQGLARVRPSLDDALGATAFAVAWRWASAEHDRNAWPGLVLVARKAVDVEIVPARLDVMARMRVGDRVIEVREGPWNEGDRGWRLAPGVGEILVRGAEGVAFGEVERIAEIARAWLE